MNKKITSVLLVSIFLTSFGAVLAAEGNVIWEKIGPGGYAYGVAVDSKDNIIVTGTGGTIKYSSNGNLLTTIIFSGNGVAVDSKDNIIVTGDDGTMKFDPNGNGLWASTLNFEGEAVAVDSKDNIIITDSSDGTMKFDPNGNALWASTISFNGRGVAVDSKDNILVNNYYFTTRKYSSNGTFIWEKKFDSGSSNDRSYGVATDSLDNVIVSGFNVNTDSTYASIIVKYSPDGTKLWDIIDNIDPRWSYKVAVDSYNNIIAAGGRYLSYDWLTKKYDPNGNRIWERSFDFAGNNDEGWAVAIDSKNDIIVTGYVTYVGGKYCTVKYQGTPPRSKPLPIAQILKILKANKDKN